MKTTLAGLALLIAIPSFAYAQPSSNDGVKDSSVPSAQQDKTPAAGTPNHPVQSGNSTGVSPAAPLGAAGEMSEHSGKSSESPR